MNEWLWNCIPIGCIESLREKMSYSNMRRTGLNDFEHVIKMDHYFDCYFYLGQMLSEYTLAVSYSGFINGLSKDDVKDVLRNSYQNFLATLEASDSVVERILPDVDNFLNLFESEWKDKNRLSSKAWDKQRTIDDLISAITPIIDVAKNSPYASLRMPVYDILGSEHAFESLIAIAVDSRDHKYIVDSSNNSIITYDENDTFIASLGSRGTANGQFLYPIGIAISSHDHKYVADSGNCRIQIFDENDNFIRSFGSKGTAEGQFHSIVDIAIDSQDMIYALDFGLKRIQRFDKDGNYIDSFSYPCTRENNHFAKAIDSHGNIYRAYSFGLRIFDKNGNFTKLFGAYNPSDFSNIAIDSQDKIYIADKGCIRIIKEQPIEDIILKLESANPTERKVAAQVLSERNDLQLMYRGKKDVNLEGSREKLRGICVLSESVSVSELKSSSINKLKLDELSASELEKSLEWLLDSPLAVYDETWTNLKEIALHPWGGMILRYVVAHCTNVRDPRVFDLRYPYDIVGLSAEIADNPTKALKQYLHLSQLLENPKNSGDTLARNMCIFIVENAGTILDYEDSKFFANPSAIAELFELKNKKHNGVIDPDKLEFLLLSLIYRRASYIKVKEFLLKMKELNKRLLRKKRRKAIVEELYALNPRIARLKINTIFLIKQIKRSN